MIDFLIPSSYIGFVKILVQNMCCCRLAHSYVSGEQIGMIDT